MTMAMSTVHDLFVVYTGTAIFACHWPAHTVQLLCCYYSQSNAVQMGVAE